MKITYNGVVIASEFVDGGTDAVTGFDPQDGKGVVQKVQYLRAAYATSIPRGNRDVTVSGTIEPAPAASLEAAMVAKADIYKSLPDQGDLVINVNGTTRTYAGAVLGPFKLLKRAGVSYGYSLTFDVGESS